MIRRIVDLPAVSPGRATRFIRVRGKMETKAIRGWIGGKQ